MAGEGLFNGGNESWRGNEPPLYSAQLWQAELVLAIQPEGQGQRIQRALESIVGPGGGDWTQVLWTQWEPSHLQSGRQPSLGNRRGHQPATVLNDFIGFSISGSLKVSSLVWDKLVFEGHTGVQDLTDAEQLEYKGPGIRVFSPGKDKQKQIMKERKTRSIQKQMLTLNRGLL